MSPDVSELLKKALALPQEARAALAGSLLESLDDTDAIRRDSLVVGPNHQRVFTIDLSKCEYVQGKRRVDLDDYAIYVYSSEMIAVEKLRAVSAFKVLQGVHQHLLSRKIQVIGRFVEHQEVREIREIRNRGQTELTPINVPTIR